MIEAERIDAYAQIMILSGTRVPHWPNSRNYNLDATMHLSYYASNNIAISVPHRQLQMQTPLPWCGGQRYIHSHNSTADNP